MVLSPPLHVGHPLGFAPEAGPRGLGSAPVSARCGGGAASWVTGPLAVPGIKKLSAEFHGSPVVG